LLLYYGLRQLLQTLTSPHSVNLYLRCALEVVEPVICVGYRLTYRGNAMIGHEQDRFVAEDLGKALAFRRIMCGRRRLGKTFLSCCSSGWVRSCVGPVLRGGEAAGHNALRGSGPNQKRAFKDALTQTGSPDPGSTLSALRRHVLANSFKLQTPSSF